ncbi:MAG: hypothetical protein JST73_05715 [Actinobacteria bacterium]|nr:hypothetical protein [Actinomycetota bacterium]
MEVRELQRGGSWKNVARGAPPAIVGAIFCTLAIGWAGTAIVIVATISLATLTLRCIYRAKRTRAADHAQLVGARLIAEAGMDAQPGQVTIWADKLTFTTRQGVESTVPYSSVTVAELYGRSIPMFVTSVNLLRMVDGNLLFKINAPLRDVRRALGKADSGVTES